MTETVAIIDYGSGNLRSMQKALERAARIADRPAEIRLVSDAEAVARADRLVLPGVGAFRACRDGLQACGGLVEALDEAVRQRGAPFLGVCVGMQLLATTGLEFGETEGLGWIDGVVRPLPDDLGLRVPHMGWDTVSFRGAHPALARIAPTEDFYFAHSFYFDTESDNDVLGVCRFGRPFPAALARGSALALQFHPEKSQAAGLHLLAGFLEWRP